MEDEAEKTQVKGTKPENREYHSQRPDQTQNWIVHPVNVAPSISNINHNEHSKIGTLSL